MRFLDLAGKRFGKYLVIRRARSRTGGSRWIVRCDCGQTLERYGSYIRKAKSCSFCKTPPTLTHGMSGTSIFNRWQAMIQRCSNPRDRNWKYYGGRGIRVCARWRKSFDAFYRDMGDPPAGLELDRRNNDRGYSKRNCKWSTRSEQNNNTRKQKRRR